MKKLICLLLVLCLCLSLAACSGNSGGSGATAAPQATENPMADTLVIGARADFTNEGKNMIYDNANEEIEPINELMWAANRLPTSFAFAYSLDKKVLDKCLAIFGRNSFLPENTSIAASVEVFGRGAQRRCNPSRT